MERMIATHNGIEIFTDQNENRKAVYTKKPIYESGGRFIVMTGNVDASTRLAMREIDKMPPHIVESNYSAG